MPSPSPAVSLRDLVLSSAEATNSDLADVAPPQEEESSSDQQPQRSDSSDWRFSKLALFPNVANLNRVSAGLIPTQRLEPLHLHLQQVEQQPPPHGRLLLPARHHDDRRWATDIDHRLDERLTDEFWQL